MKPFPDYYAGMISQIHTCQENVSVSYWAKRDDTLVQIICASPEVYLQEFPGNKVEVAHVDSWYRKEEVKNVDIR